MSKLELLIAELCPEGVEYRTISEICNISRGVVISKEDISNSIGEYPVYSSQTENNGELGKINTYAFDGEYLTWTTDGANAGTVFYRTGKFSVTNVCGLLKVIDSDNSARYIYHVLSLEAPKYVRSGMGNPKLMSNVMGDIKIPIPPLPVQEEIVRILDNFTELTAELTVELTARKKQYEYYRDNLLTFGDEVEYKALGYAFDISAGGDVPKGYFSETRTDEFSIPILSNGIEDKSLYGWTSIAKIEKPSLTISARGTIGWTSYREYPFYPIVRLLVITPKVEMSLKYAYHFMKSIENDYNVPKTGIPQLTKPMIQNILIPLPPLAEQQRIVDILDRFDTLCNDISSGLPAEIKARQQQYEYYRDKLLAFKKKEV